MSWRLRFRRALFLSLAAHGVILSVFTGIVALYFNTETGSDPQCLNFVFMPAEEAELQSINYAEDEIPNQNTKPVGHAVTIPQQTACAPNAVPPAERASLNMQPAALPAGELTNQPMPPVSPFADEIPIAPEESDLQSAVDFAPVFRDCSPQPEIFDPNYCLSAATLAIARQEKEKIDDKVEKIIEDLSYVDNKDTTIVWQWQENKYTIKIRYQPADSAMSFDEIIVNILRERDGLTMSTEKRMRRTAFSDYAKFIDYWNPHIALHDDEFDGRFHSNSVFNIMNIGKRPKFRGKVTTAAHKIKTAGMPYFSFIAQKDSVFTKGLETGTAKIKLPGQTGIKPAAKNDSLAISFWQETWLTFTADGYFSCYSKEERTPCRVKIPQQPFIISGFKKGRLHIRGVIHGKILVFSQNDIIIDGSITCKVNPRLLTNSQDYLGVVSEKDIIIAEPKVTGRGDLHLYGAYFAKKRFRIRKFWYKNDGAKLYIFGSLTAGSAGATEPRYGTRIKFDPRLRRKRPPFFPMTDQYEVTHWDKKWHTQSGN